MLMVQKRIVGLCLPYESDYILYFFNFYHNAYYGTLKLQE